MVSPRLGVENGLNSACLVGGRLFACGWNGEVVDVVLDEVASGALTRQSLSGRIYGLHGLSLNAMYAVGSGGRLFFSDGAQWRQEDSGTNVDLLTVCCVNEDTVLVGGDAGVLLRGSVSSGWEPVDADALKIHSIAAFRGSVYVGAGGSGLFQLDGDAITAVKTRIPSYRLTSTDSHLLIAGDDVAVIFDGNSWIGRRF